jgi:cytochrome c-type biogenesis protein CcmH/NrfG
MTDIKKSSTSQNWTSLQAYTLTTVCLLIGIVAGWLLRGSQSSAAVPQSTSVAAPAGMGMGAGAQPTPEQMKAMGDAQAKPLLEKLKADPQNAELLATIGNVYYDTQQYPIAIGYYEQALKIQPENTGVRTDMATAYWYGGDTDTAIAEFKKALSYEPTKPNTLFNLGIVEWQGKMDIKSAVADWKKLLEANPNYEGKDKVLDLIAQAEKHSGVKPGTPAKPLSQ